MADAPAADHGLFDLIVSTYAALLEHKLVLPSTSSPYFAVDQHFFFMCYAQTLAHIHFDKDWYVRRYPDVREAIGKGLVISPKHHYVRFGLYEHRLPYQIEIDEAWYLETYPDVKNAIEQRSCTSAQAHFEAIGFRENRLPYPIFTLPRIPPRDCK